MEDVELLMTPTTTAPAVPFASPDKEDDAPSHDASSPRKSSHSSSLVKTAAAATAPAAKPLEAALAFWSQLDLPGARRADLERQSRELKEAKDATIRNRKKLAEQTKEWKKKGAAGSSSTGAEELLKAYQEEIDNLTRRAKGADAAFAHVYQALHDAPDPTPWLAAAVQERQKSAALELELTRLHGEVEEYEAEFRKLKNQDITIRHLEETVAAYEQGAAGDVTEAIEAAREEIEALAEAQVREAVEREGRLEARLRQAQEVQAHAEAGLARAQAEVFEVARQAEENAAALRAECELLAQERERHEAEAAAARRELEAVTMAASGEDTTSSSSGGALLDASSSLGGSNRVQALQAELDEMGTSLAAVRQRLLAKEEEWTQAQGRLQAEVGQLATALADEQAAKARVKAEMRARPSPEEVAKLRSQIRLLQQLEFNGAEEEEGDQDGTAGTKRRRSVREEGAGTIQGEEVEEEEEGTPSVEHLLMQRLRRMETEVMTSRRKVAELEADKASSDEAKRAAEAHAQGQATLLAQLEEDLARVTVQQGGEEEVVAVAVAPLPSPLAAKQQQDSGDGSGSLEIDMHQLLTTAAHVVPSSSSSYSSKQPMDLVHILQAQRDRYKARVRELEGELASAEKEKERALSKAQAMERDNVTLYEKIRFLQSYGNSSSPGRPTTKASSTGPSPLPLHHRPSNEAGLEAGLMVPAATAATEARYRAMYEDKMNPFTAFSKAERVRQYQDLGLVDKITLQTTRAFLASKMARSFVFFYVVALHALVFFTLYMWGHHHCADLHYHGESLSIPPDSMTPLLGGGDGLGEGLPPLAFGGGAAVRR